MNKNRHSYCAGTLLAFVLAFLPLVAFGFSIIVSESQINDVLKLTFPYQTRIGSNQINLTEPHPLFYAASQEMGLTVHVAMKEGVNPEISAMASLRGGIHFDQDQQQLQLVRPKIEKLSWAVPPGQDQKHLTDILEQQIGQELPIIVLLDIRQLTGSYFTPVLKDLKVRNNGIEVMF